MMVTDPAIDLNKETFAAAWAKLADIREIKSPPDLPCRDCEDLPYCGYCPPVMQIESGLNVDKESYICRLGKCRRQALLDFENTLPGEYEDE